MKIFNTLTRYKEELIPIEPGRIKMYACGPTVYNYFHIGNARPFITFDTMRRYLEYRGYQVEFCQNFTDIDDKMISRANEEGITVRELADRYIAEYYVDADRLRILRPTYQPRATETMDAIIDMIAVLVDKGYAYELSDGVYYDVAKFAEYGKLSHFNLDELVEGASDRVTQSEEKRSPADFALWKKQKPGEPAWPSPWGEGRPGWHIECSAMIKKYLGETIDIHGGGQDLIFPHHENEIAQSEAANGVPFVRNWMHNGFINVDNEKMSKSAGNFFTVRDIVQKYDYDVIRFFILTGHYRMPINFSADLLDAAKSGLERIANAVSSLRFFASAGTIGETDPAAEEVLSSAIELARSQFIQAMDDDLNTADAITAIFELVRAANSAVAAGKVSKELLLRSADRIVELSHVLGIAADSLSESSSGIPKEVLDLVERRSEAKKAKNFALADEIRARIQELGYQIKDTAQGPQVTRI